jgi:hypothetical protein
MWMNVVSVMVDDQAKALRFYADPPSTSVWSLVASTSPSRRPPWAR